MKKLFFILLLLLFSCNSSPDQQVVSPYSFVEDELRKAYHRTIFAGDEKRAEFRERATDKTNMIQAVRAEMINDYLDSMDQEVGRFIQELDSIKMEIVKKIVGEDLEKVVFKADKKRNALSIDGLNLAGVRGLDKKSADLQKNASRIEGQILKMRKLLIESATSSHIETTNAAEDGSGVQFDDKYRVFVPLSDTANGIAGIREEFNTIMEDQPLYMDDKQTCFDLFNQLTLVLISWKGMMQSDITNGQAINVISSLQHNIAMQRSMVYSLVSSRIACCGNYSFTRITSFVEGAPTANLNDTIELLVGMMAYDEFKKPIVQIDGKTFDEVKDGKCIVRIPANSPGLQKIKGEISIANKSGARKVVNWEKEVYVIEKK